MKTFLEFLDEKMTSDPYYGDLAKKMNSLGDDLSRKEAEHFKRICKEFRLNWRIESGDLFVGSSFRPGADSVAMDVARQAEMALENVPGGEVERVGRGGNNLELSRYLTGLKAGQIYVRKIGVDPGFLRVLEEN